MGRRSSAGFNQRRDQNHREKQETTRDENGKHREVVSSDALKDEEKEGPCSARSGFNLSRHLASKTNTKPHGEHDDKSQIYPTVSDHKMLISTEGIMLKTVCVSV